MDVPLSSFQVHPSVLISANPSLNKDISSPVRGEVSVSGCVLPSWKRRGHTETLVITTASWLSRIVELRQDTSLLDGRVGWRYLGRDPIPSFVVLMQEASNRSVKRQIVRQADLIEVCIMTGVFSALKDSLTSLTHWRIVCGETTDEVAITDDSLVLPLSCLAVFRLRDAAGIRSGYSLNLKPSNIDTGKVIHTIGTPFGSFCPEVFTNCLISGSISKLLGVNGAVLITDINLPPGSEGSLILNKPPTSEYRPDPHCPVLDVLGIVIATLSSESGQPSSLSLACSAHSILGVLESCGVDIEGLNDVFINTQQGVSAVSVCLPSLIETVVVVCCSDCSWGSGVLLSPSVVLTCSHVIQGKQGISVLMQDGSKLQASVIFSSSTPDCTLLKLTGPALPQYTMLTWYGKKNVPSSNRPTIVEEDKVKRSYGRHVVSSKMTELPNTYSLATARKPPLPAEGIAVLVIGLGFQDPHEMKTHVTPLVTRGAICKVVNDEKGKLEMFLTTAVVLPGMSGGLVVEALSGEPLGMAVSNSLDVENELSYPRMNYCLPFSWILPPLIDFLSTNDHTHLKTLTSVGERIAHLWRLESNYTVHEGALNFVSSKL